MESSRWMELFMIILMRCSVFVDETNYLPIWMCRSSWRRERCMHANVFVIVSHYLQYCTRATHSASAFSLCVSNLDDDDEIGTFTIYTRRASFRRPVSVAWLLLLEASPPPCQSTRSSAGWQTQLCQHRLVAAADWIRWRERSLVEWFCATVIK